MKRLLRPVALVLVMALLAGGAYGLSGGDSLVSLRYLTETFFPRRSRPGRRPPTAPWRRPMTGPGTSWPRSRGARLARARGGCTARPCNSGSGATDRPSP